MKCGTSYYFIYTMIWFNILPMLVIELCMSLYLLHIIILFTFRRLAETFLQSNFHITLTYKEPFEVQCSFQGYVVHVAIRYWESNHWPSGLWMIVLNDCFTGWGTAARSVKQSLKTLIVNHHFNNRGHFGWTTWFLKLDPSGLQAWLPCWLDRATQESDKVAA